WDHYLIRAARLSHIAEPMSGFVEKTLVEPGAVERHAFVLRHDVEVGRRPRFAAAHGLVVSLVLLRPVLHIVGQLLPTSVVRGHTHLTDGRILRLSPRDGKRKQEGRLVAS